MKTTISFCLFLLLVGASPCHGEVVFELFVRAAGVDGIDTEIELNPSDRIVGVELILRETVTGSSNSFLAQSNLNAFSARVTATDADGNFDNLTLDTTGGFAAGSGEAGVITFAALGSGFGSPGKPGIEVATNVREIVLGTMDIIAPTSGSTRFTVDDATPNDGDFTTFGSGDQGLETLSADTGGGFFGRTLTVTAVPEPSFFALGLLGVGVVGTRRSRRS